MRLYLAGPMSGIKDFNFPAFNEAAEHLRKLGYEVFNPAEADVERDGFDPTKDDAEPFLHYMQRDLPEVMASDGIAVLPGWKDSKGACLEVKVARECGLRVIDAKTGGPYFGQEVLPSEMVTSEPETILQEAQRLVYGARRETYGHPLDDYTRTATMWSAILGTTVTAEQAILCMIAVKISFFTLPQ